jgi:hypothetical protein
MNKLSWRRGRVVLPLAAGACLLNAAFAVMISGGGAAPQKDGSGSPVIAGSGGLPLIAGRVSAINLKKMTLTIADRSMALHPTDLRVYAGGAVVPAAQLQPGARVRYALEPGPARRVVLILIDGQP